MASTTDNGSLGTGESSPGNSAVPSGRSLSGGSGNTPEQAQYEVVVGNIGLVFSGSSLVFARTCFNNYKVQSICSWGRAAGESVTLFKDDEIFDEYVPVTGEEL